MDPLAEAFLEGHWSDITGESGDDENQKTLQKNLEMATNYRQAFSTEAGKLVLQDLINTYLCQRIVCPGDEAKTDAIRQGSADIVVRIIKYIQFAETGGSIRQ